MTTPTDRRDYFVSGLVRGSVMTGLVTVEGGTIVHTAPVWRKFIGQPFANLKRWLVSTAIVELPRP